MADKYGIPEGGDPYPGKIKYLGGNKRTLTAREIFAAVKEAGWPADKRTLATAVALAESGGSPFIYNTYKQGHFGLFQISRSAWPEFFTGGSDQWADPVANARKAYEIYKKQGWKAWQGYTNDKWKDHRNAVADAANDDLRGRPLGPGLLGDIKEHGLASVIGTATEVIGDAAEGTADAVVDGASAAVDILGDAWNALTTPAFWMRVAYGAAGVILVAGGLFLLVRNTSAGKAVTPPAVRAVTAVKKVAA